MKKILLALGTTTSIIAPVVGVIACGATKKPETPQPIIVDKPKPPVSSTTVPGGTTQAPVVQPITSGTGTSGTGTSGTGTSGTGTSGTGTSGTGTQSGTQTGSQSSITKPVVFPNVHNAKVFYANTTSFKVKIPGATLSSTVFRLIKDGKITYSKGLNKWELIPTTSLSVGSSVAFTQNIIVDGKIINTKQINLEVQQASIEDLILQDDNGNIVITIPSLNDADRFDRDKTILAKIIKWVNSIIPSNAKASQNNIIIFLKSIGMRNVDVQILSSDIFTS